MAKARITLTKALTHDGRGRHFSKGAPQVIDNDADIAYYKAQPEFSVTLLKDAPAKAGLKPLPPKPEAPPADDNLPADEAVTAELLNKMTKTELINFASGEPYNLALDNEMKKADMIADILLVVETEAELKD